MMKKFILLGHEWERFTHAFDSFEARQTSWNKHGKTNRSSTNTKKFPFLLILERKLF